MALLVAVACIFLIPHPRLQNKRSQLERSRRLDLSGSTLLIGKRSRVRWTISNPNMQGCSSVLYLRSDVWLDRWMEDCYSLDPPFFVCSSFRLVLRLGSTNSRGSRLSACLLALLFNTFILCRCLGPQVGGGVPFAPLVTLALLPYTWWDTVYLFFAWY